MSHVLRPPQLDAKTYIDVERLGQKRNVPNIRVSSDTLDSCGVAVHTLP
jgi:hypothetical protein